MCTCCAASHSFLCPSGRQGVPRRQNVTTHAWPRGGRLSGDQGAYLQAAIHSQHEGEDWHGEPCFLKKRSHWQWAQRMLVKFPSQELKSVLVC